MPKWMLDIRGSLKRAVLNVETENVLVSFSVGFYLTVHDIRPMVGQLTPTAATQLGHYVTE